MHKRASETERAPRFDELGIELEPLANFGLANEIDLQADLTRLATADPGVTLCTSMRDNPMALSASAEIRPPCTSPRELQCASRTWSPIKTLSGRVFE